MSENETDPELKDEEIEQPEVETVDKVYDKESEPGAEIAIMLEKGTYNEVKDEEIEPEAKVMKH